MFCLTTSELIGNSYVADLGSKKKFYWSRHHSSNILRFDWLIDFVRVKSIFLINRFRDQLLFSKRETICLNQFYWKSILEKKVCYSEIVEFKCPFMHGKDTIKEQLITSVVNNRSWSLIVVLLIILIHVLIIAHFISFKMKKNFVFLVLFYVGFWHTIPQLMIYYIFYLFYLGLVY